MPPERDLFANFERMRREMDELFGDVFDRTGLAPSRRGGFSPAVDVFYAGDPPRAVVQAELAGIDPDELTLEIEGRELVIAGHRRPEDAEGRLYQQLEIDFGPFRRVIPLGAEVVPSRARATYTDGILRIELPLARPEARSRSVPIEVARGDDVVEGRGSTSPAAAATNARSRSAPSARCPGRCRSCPCARRSRCPTRSRRWRSARSARSSSSTTCWPATACWSWSLRRTRSSSSRAPTTCT